MMFIGAIAVFSICIFWSCNKKGKTILRYGLVFLAVCGLWASAAQAAVEYSVFNLSAEWDAEFSQPEIVRGWYALSINNSGQVAGHATTVDNGHIAMIWDSVNGLRDFSDMEGSTKARDINNLGQIALNGDTGAFLWDENTGLQQITGWGNGPLHASYINDLGQIAGKHWPDNDLPSAFFWNGGIVQDIGSLGGDGVGVYDINNLGQVVGWSDLSVGPSHGFIWDDDNGIRDLGVAGLHSSATGINDLGQVVGRSEMESGQIHAVLWEDGQMIDLDTLGGEYSDSSAINNLGQVIGSVQMPAVVGSPQYPASEYFPFIWDSVNGTRNLNDLLPPESDWRIFSAADINDNGWITATAFEGDSNKYQIVLLKPVPEPSCLMLIIGVAAIFLICIFRLHNKKGRIS